MMKARFEAEVLRRGFASLVHAGGLKQRGASVRAVQAWLGHSTLSVTERYTHLARPTPEADRLFDRLHLVVGKWGPKPASGRPTARTVARCRCR